MSIEQVIQKCAGRVARSLTRPINRMAYLRFYDFPFGKKPWASEEAYLKIFEEARKTPYRHVDEFEKESGFAIDSAWFHALALQTQVVIKESDICYQHGRLLYSALSRFITGTRLKSLNILETGTSRGFSSLCMAKAMEDRGQAGKIQTFDVLPHDIRMYWNCIADKEGPCTRSELLSHYKALMEQYVVYHQGDTKIELGKMDMSRIHFAFLDGMHTYDYVMHEFSYLQKTQQKGDVVFFDDYTPRLFPDLVRAVDEICEKNGYLKKVMTLSDQRGFVIASKQ